MADTAGLRAFPLIAFVTITDPEPAKAFYRDKLGLPLVSEELPYAIVFDAHGTMLRLAIDPQFTPVRGTVLGWHVLNMQSAVRDLAKAGVALERYDFLKQDEQGIWTTPTGAQVAWFKDPDGNVLSISQMPQHLA